MITPNKFVPFDNSIISKIHILLTLNISEIEISELYKKVSHNFNGIDEFIYTLDVLYILNRIEIDFHNRIIFYVS